MTPRDIALLHRGDSPLAFFLLSCLASTLLIFSALTFPSPSSPHPPVTAPSPRPPRSSGEGVRPSGPDAATATASQHLLLPPSVRPFSTSIAPVPSRRGGPTSSCPPPSTGIGSGGGVFPAIFPKGNPSPGFLRAVLGGPGEEQSYCRG